MAPSTLETAPDTAIAIAERIDLNSAIAWTIRACYRHDDVNALLANQDDPKNAARLAEMKNSEQVQHLMSIDGD